MLRGEPDWDVAIAPSAVSAGGEAWTFELDGPAPSIAFKPCLVDPTGTTFSVGNDYRARDGIPREVAPYFRSPPKGSVRRGFVVGGSAVGPRQVDVYLPPGYDENTERTYPVLYFQDGQHVFTGAGEWQVDEGLDLLDSVDMVAKVIGVAVHAGADRNELYTHRRWDAYTTFLADELVPKVDASFRTRRGAADRTLVGASLGATVSLHAAWARPEVFGNVVGLSGRFDLPEIDGDLPARVAAGPKRALRIYLDSGSPPTPDAGADVPNDNFPLVRRFVDRLVDAGFAQGHDLNYAVYPLQRHTREAWAMRWAVPFQWLYGKV